MSNPSDAPLSVAEAATIKASALRIMTYFDLWERDDGEVNIPASQGDVAWLEQIIGRAVEAEVGRLREIMAELADEVEAQVNEDYPSFSREQYPSYQRRFERDMAVVVRARRALAASGKEDGDGE